MKCPHCLVEFHPQVEWKYLGKDSKGNWLIERYVCPNPKCKRQILYLVQGTPEFVKGTPTIGSVQRWGEPLMVYPKGSNRPPVPPEVPPEFGSDYREACLVLADSPKASAALSRRSLEGILREKAGANPSNLAHEIEDVLGRNVLPSYIAEMVDAVRNVGNFATHPNKSKQTGEVIDVEVGEADLNLDVLEALLDFYFVLPARAAEKKAAINQKLQDAGKPQMK